MWNYAVLIDSTMQVVLSQQETAIYCELALPVIDSYGVNIYLAKSTVLEMYFFYPQI
jgi:hypothetical protein